MSFKCREAVKCDRCGLMINEGDPIRWNRTQNGGKPKRFHEDCFKAPQTNGKTRVIDIRKVLQDPKQRAILLRMLERGIKAAGRDGTRRD